MNLGTIIREYRKQTRMSLNNFAERAGVSKAYISILENNKVPSSTGKEIVPSISTVRHL